MLRPDDGRRRRPRYSIHRLKLVSALVVLVALIPLGVQAAPADAALLDLDIAEQEVFGADTPLGRVSYQAGRGLRIGDTGLVLGGFTTAQVESLEREDGGEDSEGDEDSEEDAGADSDSGGTRGELEGLNLFVFYDPLPFAHLFGEVEVGPLAELESGEDGVRVNPELDIDRLYLDLAASDSLNLRLGKFLTPIGRRNLAPAEPLTWTTSEPLIVEEVFDETTTGAMLFGSTFPGGEALSYSLYGTFLNPIDADPQTPPAERTAGAHVEWASLGGLTLGASYFASRLEGGEWNHLGGADLLWQPNERVEVNGEAVFGEGSLQDGGLSGFYVEGAVETIDTLYAVGRYERFDPPEAESAVNLFDLGLAWVPAPYLRLKADYLFADHLDELAEPGFRMSLSILF